jgi:hypothetical protein
LIAPATTSMASAVRWIDLTRGVAVVTFDIAISSP